MTQQRLNKNSPFFERLSAYFKERFPLLSHGILIVSYYSSNQFLSQVLSHPHSPVTYSKYSLLGAITIFFVFLHLRVFDEHKDYEEDCRHYPQRVLSRGLITLTHLKILGSIAIGIEIFISAFRGWPALLAVFMVLAYSLLMLKEFFVRRWLKRHFFVYAISHMLIMPLLALTVYSFTTLRYPWGAPAWFWVYAFVGFFVTFNWEVSRKIRAPEDEIETVDSYSKILGTYGAANLVVIIRVVDTLLVSLVGWHLKLSSWFYFILVILFLICLQGFIQFRLHPSARTAKWIEKYAGFYMIAFDLTLVVAIFKGYGITF